MRGQHEPIPGPFEHRDRSLVAATEGIRPAHGVGDGVDVSSDCSMPMGGTRVTKILDALGQPSAPRQTANPASLRDSRHWHLVRTGRKARDGRLRRAAPRVHLVHILSGPPPLSSLVTVRNDADPALGESLNSVCNPQLVFDEGRAIVSSRQPKIGVSARVYYTSGDRDEELHAITDSKLVEFR
jgi:hypothetical protein